MQISSLSFISYDFGKEKKPDFQLEVRLLEIHLVLATTAQLVDQQVD